MAKINLLSLKNCPIFQQLQIEEMLLRTSEDNWCVINSGSTPAIVLGISGKVEEMVHTEKHKKKPIPLIKRYSGGGTVVVDENTLFVSFIFQKSAHTFPLFPEHILRWSTSFYKEAFDIKGFNLKENDYVIGNKKCGGNAQYIQKNRFVHHTTFLWDFKPELMSLLTHPKKTPSYRKGRCHGEFLCSLNKYFPFKKVVLDSIKTALLYTYSVKEVSAPILAKGQKHRKSTALVKTTK